MPTVTPQPIGERFSTTIRSPSVAVAVRASWLVPWVSVAHLHLNWLEWALPPAISQAELEWRFGVGSPPGVVYNAVWAPLELVDQFVRIRLTLPLPEGADEDDPPEVVDWYGVIVDDTPQREGRWTNAAYPAGASRGVQLLRCVGLEYLLHQQPILQSLVERHDISLSSEDGVTELLIGRALAFNAGGSALDRIDPLRGNATATKSGSRGTKIFAADPANDDRWSAWDILEYLLAYHVPYGNDGVEQVPWHLPVSGEALPQFLDAVHPKVEAQGRTLFEMLNELADRRRLLGWKLRIDEPADQDDFDPAEHGARLELVSWTATDLEIPSVDDTGEPRILPANPRQWTFDYDQAVNVQRAELTRETARKIDQVLLRGARRTSTFSLSPADGTLEPDWTLGQELAYQAGASANAGYDDLFDHAKREADELRRRQDHQRRVFRYFRLPALWDGQVGDGEGGETSVAFPQLDADYEHALEEGRAFWRAGLRFLPTLPILSDHNYDQEGAIVDGTPAGSNPHWLRPRAWFACGENSGGQVIYQPADAPVHTGDLDRVTHPGATWSATLEMQQHAPGVILDVHGAPQHALALGRFTPQIHDVPPGIDFETLIVTLCCEMDDHLEIAEPRDLPDDTKSTRRLVIEVPELRLDYCHPGAVLDMVDGRPRRSATEWINDDRPLARQILALAHGWHGRTRHKLRLSFVGCWLDVRAGDLVASLGKQPAEGDPDTRETVDTVVTRVHYDAQANSTTIETDFTQLDAAGLALG